MNGSRKPVQFVINDHMTRYLRLWRSLGSRNAKRALALTEEKCEIVYPMHEWFHPDWSINEKTYEHMKQNNLIGNRGTFHSIMFIHPLIPHFNVDYDDDSKREENIKLITAQIRLSARLGADYPGPKILVFHPGPSRKPHVNDYLDTMVKCFAPALEVADELNVQLTFEPDLGAGKMYLHGASNHYDNVLTLVQRLTALAPRKNLSMPVSITCDTSHTLIMAKMDFGKVKNIVLQYADYISYAHVNFPMTILSRFAHEPHLNQPISELNEVQKLWVVFGGTLDGHNPIQRAPKEFFEILRLLATKTRIPEYGRVNLEVGTRWDRGFNFWRSGSGALGTYKSLLILDKIFNEKI